MPSVRLAVFSSVEGYHQYSEGCSVRIFSTVEGYHQYSEGGSVLWRMFSTVEDVQY